MTDINYVIREDGLGKIITDDMEFGLIDVEDILPKEYPYILDSINKEDYYIEDYISQLFKEIVFENKVVGFATYDMDYYGSLILTDCYILPDFRGKGLFFDEILRMSSSAPRLTIMQPTRKVIELLLKYSFAKKITDNIVVSAIAFYFDDFHVKSNKRDEVEDDLDLTNFYDLSICSTILVDDDEVFYHKSLKNDLKEYGERKTLTEDYFTEIMSIFHDKDEEFEQVLSEVISQMPEIEFGFDEMIGRGEGLSEFMQAMVDDGDISYENAIKIKEQLTKEYDDGQVDDENLENRFMELIFPYLIGDGDVDDFLNLLGSSDVGEDDVNLTKGLFDLVGDNEELVNNILMSIINDDEMAFENIIMSEMEKNEEFRDNFLNMAEELSENEEFFIDDTQSSLFDFNPDDEKSSLSDVDFGIEYPTSYDLDIYRVLRNLKKHNDLLASIAFSDLEQSGNPDFIAEVLLNGNFIDDSVTYENWDEFAHESLTISDLKKILKKNNLKVSGKKQELIDRISENKIPLDEFKTNMVKITPKGEKYLEDYKWIDFYEVFLYPFNFDDFYFYLEHHSGDIDEIARQYLNEYIDLANENNDAELLSISMNMLNFINNFGEKFLKKLNS